MDFDFAMAAEPSDDSEPRSDGFKPDDVALNILVDMNIEEMKLSDQIDNSDLPILLIPDAYRSKPSIHPMTLNYKEISLNLIQCKVSHKFL
jgi:hypothetical protein